MSSSRLSRLYWCFRLTKIKSFTVFLSFIQIILMFQTNKNWIWICWRTRRVVINTSSNDFDFWLFYARIFSAITIQIGVQAIFLFNFRVFSGWTVFLLFDVYWYISVYFLFLFQNFCSIYQNLCPISFKQC